MSQEKFAIVSHTYNGDLTINEFRKALLFQDRRLVRGVINTFIMHSLERCDTGSYLSVEGHVPPIIEFPAPFL